MRWRCASARKYADTLRYVASFGKWYEWQSPIWREDSTLQIFDYARALCREASNELGRSQGR